MQAMHEYGLWATMERRTLTMSGFTRHRRSGRVIATFSGFEADLLRSLASQLVELLRNEAAVAARRADPLEAMLDFSGPTTEPDDPVLARLFPTAYPDDEEAAGGVPALHRGRPARRQGGRRGHDHRHARGGRPARRARRGRAVIDVELDEPAAMTWLRSFTDMRLALATRLGVEEDDEESWLALPDDDPRAQVARHLRLARATSRRPSSTPVPLALTRSQDADRAAGRTGRRTPPPTLGAC